MRGPPCSVEDVEALDLAYARFNSVRSLRVADPELTVEAVGELTALRDPSRPRDETYNRVLGLRDGRLLELDAALALYEGDESGSKAGPPPQVDVPIDACAPEVFAGLAARGLTPTRAVAWLAARPSELERSLPARIDVRRLYPEDAGRLLDLIGSGGEPIEDAVRERRERYYCTDRFPAFVATLDGVPAGWATLFIDGDRGVFGNACTLPAHRRRGVQRALFAARADHAARAGLSWVVTDMELDSGSYRNAVRAGFTRRTVMLWYRRADDQGVS